MSFLGDHGESLYKSGRVLTQCGFADDTIVSFLGDHGESLYKSGRVLTQYGFADIIVSFVGDHGKSLYKPGLVLTQYGLLTTSWCPFWETTVRVYISQGECWPSTALLQATPLILSFLETTVRT